MADLLSIARPYALAAFEYAREKKQLPAWKAFLASAAEVAKAHSVVRLLSNPEVSSTKAFELFKEVLAEILQPDQQNFLLLLAQNKRLMILPDVSTLFNTFYAYYEKLSTVRVVTAVDMPEEFRKNLTSALTNKTQREVTIENKVDPSIVGGAVIYIGDRVIDGSIRGQLARLLQSLTG